ncbi:MAG: proline racemase family protein [Fimbriimonadaceae bacterium]
MQKFRAIDSHSGGEPTRVVFGESLGLIGNSMAEIRAEFAARFDDLRSAFVCEPRGSDILVGALLVPGFEHQWGVVFFNNVGMLNMCGHGTIGVAETLLFLGEWGVGDHVLETPVGDVGVRINADRTVEFANVPSFVGARSVEVRLSDRVVTGDVAWGGNWFYLCDDHGLSIDLGNLGELTRVSEDIRRFLLREGIRGSDGGEIDHVELVVKQEGGAKNFVLCPGLAYDRSPCGTGTSAKLACLYERDTIQPGEIWRQESVTGSVFEGWVEIIDGKCIPHIRGRAFITAETELILDPDDPLRFGFTGVQF